MIWRMVTAVAMGASSLIGGGAALHGARRSPSARPARGGTVACSRSSETPRVVRLRVVDVGAGAIAVVGVCVQHQGPFPFVVDTGSSLSLIATPLARRLRLPQAGRARTAQGIRCTERVAPVEVTSWSLGGLALRPQQVLRGAMPTVPHVRLEGVLGSDVLSRFGAIRIDFRSDTLTVAAAEGTAPSRALRVEHESTRPTPATLRHRIRLQAPLLVVSDHGAVEVAVAAEVGGVPTGLVVDTGAAVSAVAYPVARSGHLSPTGTTVLLAAVGCPARLTEVDSGRWSIGRQELPPQAIGVLPARGIRIGGMLGSDVLRRYGVVVVDYRDARLLLEAA